MQSTLIVVLIEIKFKAGARRSYFCTFEPGIGTKELTMKNIKYRISPIRKNISINIYHWKLISTNFPRQTRFHGNVTDLILILLTGRSTNI